MKPYRLPQLTRLKLPSLNKSRYATEEKEELGRTDRSSNKSKSQHQNSELKFEKLI